MNTSIDSFKTLKQDAEHRINITRTPGAFMIDVEDGAQWAALTLDDSQARTLATWIQDLLTGEQE